MEPIKPRHPEPPRSGVSKDAVDDRRSVPGVGNFPWRDPGRDKPLSGGVKRVVMILSASQFYFWYFATPTLLAPDEDRSA
jgi:hypothetical protein